MKWRIVSPQHCIFAKRVASMTGLEYSDQATGAEAAFFIEMFQPMIDKAVEFTGPKICWWTGTDARIFAESPNSPDFGNAFHVTDTPWLVYLLSRKLKMVCFLPMPCSISTEPLPYPEDPAILFYLNEHRARDVERSKAFIQYHRKIPIYVMCGIYNRPIMDIAAPGQTNVIRVDNVPDDDRLELFKKIGVYVRFMHFDGMSQLTIEMKILGRHVITTEFVPYAEIVSVKDSLRDISERMRNLIKQPPDPEGAKWYKQVFSMATFRRVLNGIGEQRHWGRIIYA